MHRNSQVSFKNIKVALVHDQLQEFGGAERVLVELMAIFPDAQVFTSFYSPKKLGRHAKKFENKKIITSWASRIYGLNRLISPLRFLFPFIWESFDLSQFDLVISSSGGWSSHGIITKKSTIHICYLHTPPRYLYGYETAIEWQKYFIIRIYGKMINYYLRKWDKKAGNRPDYFIANSQTVKNRIKNIYKRESIVIYPPVNLSQENIYLKQNKKEYYLTVSRLAGAKHVDLQINASNQAGFLLKIVGVGRCEKQLKKIANEKVEFLHSIPDAEFDVVYKSAKAFINTAVDEEFGISAVESLGRGVPVIAYASGGLRETIIDQNNGMLFHKLDVNELNNTIKKFEQLSSNEIEQMSKNAFKSARQYSKHNFQEKLLDFIYKLNILTK